MVSLVNSHTNATRIGWHLWEIDLAICPWVTSRVDEWAEGVAPPAPQLRPRPEPPCHTHPHSTAARAASGHFRAAVFRCRDPPHCHQPLRILRWLLPSRPLLSCPLLLPTSAPHLSPPPLPFQRPRPGDANPAVFRRSTPQNAALAAACPTHARWPRQAGGFPAWFRGTQRADLKKTAFQSSRTDQIVDFQSSDLPKMS